MSRIADIAAELTAGHPVTGAYDPDAATAAAQMNAENVTRIKTSMTGDELFSATDTAQFNSLTDVQKQLWLAFCGRETIDPSGAANVAFVTGLFGAGTATVTNLVAARQETVSRGVVIGVGWVRTGDILQARA